MNNRLIGNKKNIFQFIWLDQGWKHQNLIFRPNYSPKTTIRPGLNRGLAPFQKNPKKSPEAGPGGELDYGLIKKFVI